jgi:hypothetical protein
MNFIKKIAFSSLLATSILNAQAQQGVKVGDNPTTISNSAVLEVESTNKGVLLPRVALTSSTDVTTVAGPTNGLLVYNTGTGGLDYIGYVYWNGTEWRTFVNSSTASATLSDFSCTSAIASPSSYTSGIPYNGTIRVPYQGGNGGQYPAQSVGPVNGLTVSRAAGVLNIGAGEIVYTVSGTPNISSPSTITFSGLGIGSNTCAITIGGAGNNASITAQAYVGQLTSVSTPRAGYELVGNTPDGKWSCRIFVPTGTSFADANLQLRNNSNDTIQIMQNVSYFWGGGGTVMGNLISHPHNQWAGYSSDASGAVSATVQTASNFPAWGDPGIFAGNLPEYRLYHWSTSDPAEKTFYTLEFMMSNTNPGSLANATNCPSGTCNTVKVFFNIRQISAP